MKTIIGTLNLLIYFDIVLCRDFYIGIFNKNDFLVAQDAVFKQKRFYSNVYADYGRLFKCPITYFRVVDRLGGRGGPTVQIKRGGLRKKYIAVRIRSQYNMPISVNIYVGCENKQPKRTTTKKKPVTKAVSKEANETTTQVATQGDKATTNTGETKSNVTEKGEGAQNSTQANDGTEGSSDGTTKIPDAENEPGNEPE